VLRGKEELKIQERTKIILEEQSSRGDRIMATIEGVDYPWISKEVNIRLQ
jgi:hypothetical protein